MTVSALADSIVNLPSDDVTTAAAIRCVIDWAGCAVGGAGHPATTALVNSLGVIGGGDAATVVGRTARASPFGAALVNGAASHVLDFDDVNVVMIGHPGVAVIPAALAVAEHGDVDGRTFLSGVVAGYETAHLLGQVVNPDHYERGWHATATIGTIAAAAACARVWGQDAATTAQTLTAAATSSGGIRAVFGTHGKAFNAGRAASAGLLACAAVQSGMQMPGDGIAGPAGWLEATGGTSRRQDVDVSGPAILQTAFKSHAACGATHCLIDAVAELVGQHGLSADDIVRIDAQVHPLAVRAAGISSPTTGLEAKFSLRQAAAMAVLAHPLLPDAFTDDAARDPLVVALRERVEIVVDDSLPYTEAMPADVRITTRDGTLVRTRVDAPRGRPTNPMSDPELDAKFRGLTSPVLGSSRAETALQALRGLDRADEVGVVVRCLT